MTDRGSRLFTGYRALGFTSNAVPLCVRYDEKRRENYVLTCVGRAFHTYNVSFDTGDLPQHWHMRITSSKCVLQQRHLLGYQSRTPTLNPNPRTHPNPIFNPNPNRFFFKENKNDTGI